MTAIACDLPEGPGARRTIPRATEEPKVWGCVRVDHQSHDPNAPYRLQVFGPNGGSWARGGRGTRGTAAAATVTHREGAGEEETTYTVVADPPLDLSRYVNHLVEMTVRPHEADADGPFEATAIMVISASCPETS